MVGFDPKNVGIMTIIPLIDIYQANHFSHEDKNHQVKTTPFLNVEINFVFNQYQRKSKSIKKII